MNDGEYWTTLGWGIGTQAIKDKVTEAFDYSQQTGYPYESGVLTFGDVTLYNFPGDCGALILSGANYASEEELKQAMKYASLSGFNKMFATIVTNWLADEQKELFTNLGWQVVFEGKSNRNSDKVDIGLVLHILNPIHKGY